MVSTIIPLFIPLFTSHLFIFRIGHGINLLIRTVPFRTTD